MKTFYGLAGRLLGALAFVLVAIAPVPEARAQLNASQTWSGTSTSVSNVYTINVHNISQLNDLLGVPLRFIPNSVNTGVTTLKVHLDSGSDLGPLNVLKPSQTGSGLLALIGAEFQTSQIVTVMYDGTQFQCQSCLQKTTLPTKQVFLAGTSGTYTTPAGVLSIELHIVGGGGGGGANGVGTVGGNSCWNTSGAACTSPVYQAGGGGAGGLASGGAGGTITGSGSCDWSVAGSGGQGGPTAPTGANMAGGKGGDSTLGGGGQTAANVAGSNGAANSGGGAGGGGVNSTGNAGAGGGGGSGASCHVIINSPAATYTYAVANTAAGATAGGVNLAGGIGAGGQIIVYERYN